MTAATGIPFDHRDSGTAEDLWAATLPRLDMAALDLDHYRHVVVAAAHPDDETLGAGGLLAAAARLGLAVTVVVATLGERSHPDSPTHTPGDLARIRRAEVFAAIGRLSPTATVRLLGLPDGELDRHGAELVAALTAVVGDASTLVLAPYSADGHPDHEALGAAAALVAAQTGATALEYPIWMWHWSTPDRLPPHLVRLELGAEHLEAKREALAAHGSQIRDLSAQAGDEAIVAPFFAAHFERPYEVFVAASVATAPDSPVGEPAPGDSLPVEFFDDFYGDRTDPWGFETRWYEERKRALTLASLPRQRFSSGYEPGCSIGVLTAALAGRCDRLLGTDISDAPLLIARQRLSGSNTTNVILERRRVPRDWPVEKFDLIVLSEIGYYCDSADLSTLVAQAAGSLTPDGVLVACHWRHRVEEYPLRGDDVHRALRSEPGLAVLAAHEEEDFLLDVFVRPPVVSVARMTGLVS